MSARKLSAPLPDRGPLDALFKIEDRLAQRLREIRGLTSLLAAAALNDEAPPSAHDTQAVCFLAYELIRDAEQAALGISTRRMDGAQ